MPIYVIYAEATDGFVSSLEPDYPTAHTTGSGFNSSLDRSIVGQNVPIPNNRVYRSFFEFDRSVIPSSYVILSRTLTLSVYSNQSDTDFDVVIRPCAWESPLSALNQDANFDAALAASGDVIWRNTSGIALNTPYTSPALPEMYISEAGLIQFALLSSLDIAASQPIGDEYIRIWTREAATEAYRPYLTIIAVPPGSIVQTLVHSGERAQLRFCWHGTGIPVRLDLESPVYGTLERFVAYHSDAGVAGSTYDVHIRDPLGGDVLVGLAEGLSFNATAESPISKQLATDRRRTIPVGGQLWIEIDAGDDDTHGIFDLYFRTKVDAAAEIR